MQRGLRTHPTTGRIVAFGVLHYRRKPALEIITECCLGILQTLQLLSQDARAGCRGPLEGRRRLVVELGFRSGVSGARFRSGVSGARSPRRRSRMTRSGWGKAPRPRPMRRRYSEFNAANIHALILQELFDLNSQHEGQGTSSASPPRQ